MPVSRAVKESPLTQGVDESIAYTVTTTPWGSTPTSVAVKLYEGADRTDRTSTMLTGTASVSGDIITCPYVSGLTANTYYLLEVKFTVSGNVEETHLIILAEQ